jgi:hypothetical protein
MNDYYYETLAWHEARRVSAPPILEAFRGTQVVEWWGRIERQLIDKVNAFQTSRDFDSKAKAQAYLEIWRANELTGSINVDAVNALLGPAQVLAVDNWGESNYFAKLRDSLRQLKASQEELPPLGDEDMGGPARPRPRRSMSPVVEQPPPGGEGDAEAELAPEEAPSQDYGPEAEPGETELADDEEEIPVNA